MPPSQADASVALNQCRQIRRVPLLSCCIGCRQSCRLGRRRSHEELGAAAGLRSWMLPPLLDSGLGAVVILLRLARLFSGRRLSRGRTPSI
jgi:hypothetical protein